MQKICLISSLDDGLSWNAWCERPHRAVIGSPVPYTRTLLTCALEPNGYLWQQGVSSPPAAVLHYVWVGLQPTYLPRWVYSRPGQQVRPR
jgi:hypothetical protein